MPDIRVPLVNGEYYHIFNRGVAHQPIFLRQRDYEQSMLALAYYRFKDPPIRLSRLKELGRERQQEILTQLTTRNETLIRIISFVFMPNHFHFLLQQATENGISKFVSQFSNSCTKYFNMKYQRIGPLLQGVFKAVRIETDEQLLHVSRYIHLNPLVSFVVKDDDFLSYPWSSLEEYLRGKSNLVFLDPVLSHFSSPEDYKTFVLDQADYGKKLEQIKHLLLEQFK